MFILCIIFSILILAIARFFYKEPCPAKIFMYYWAGQVLFLLVGGYGYLIFCYSGVLFILFCLLFLHLGAFSFRTNPFSYCERQHQYSINVSRKKLLRWVFVLTILGFYIPVKTIISQGFSLSSLLNFQMLLEVNNTLSVSRYSDQVLGVGGWLTQSLGVFSYTAPLIGGFALPICQTKANRVICLCSLLPLFFGGLTQGVKMGMITAALLFISGYIICSFLINRAIQIKVKSIIYGITIIVAFFGVLLLSMMFRMGQFDVDTFYIVTGKFISYAFGHLPAFDVWFDNQNFFPNELTFGGKFFLGITNFFGIMKREQGLYQEYVTISIAGDQTNVFTLFRVLIDDFGIIGTPFFCFVLGYLSQKAYIMLKFLADYRFASTFLVAFYFMTFWSFVTSIFVYTSYIVMFILFYFIISTTIRKVINRNA